MPQTVLISDSLSVFKSRIKTFLIQSGFYWILIRPAASASEVMTIWRYRNSIIIIIKSQLHCVREKSNLLDNVW